MKQEKEQELRPVIVSFEIMSKPDAAECTEGDGAFCTF